MSPTLLWSSRSLLGHFLHGLRWMSPKKWYHSSTNELLKSQWVIMAILHLSYFLEFNCSSFWKVTCNGWVPRTEQFQCAPTRRNLSTTSENKCTVLSGHHFSALGKSSRWELQSSPKRHIQTVWNQGAVIKLQPWCFSHFRPRYQSPHQLLSATSQRCGSMKALQLTWKMHPRCLNWEQF